MAFLLRPSELAKVRPASLQGLVVAAVGLTVLYIVYVVGSAIRNIYFHPLSHVPGPKLWIAFPLTKWIRSFKGCMDADIRYYHDIYGPTIRVGPTELTFTSATAWTDIYGFKNNPELPREFTVDPDHNYSTILHSSPADHARYRKALTYGFSEKSLREQEALMTSYVDLLIRRLREATENGQAVNMVQWYNCTTFDVISDLSFGKSLSCLERGSMSKYLTTLLDMFKTVPIIGGAKSYPILMFLMAHLFLPKQVKESRNYHFKFARDCISERLSNGNQHGRPDFVDSMSRGKGTAAEISETEMANNAVMLLMAGSETTSSLLAGLTYYLLRNPRVLEIVQREVRTTFADESDISIASVSSRCPYLFACLEEGLRIYPPTPSSFQRLAVHQPPFAVDGVLVPPGTTLGVHISAAFWTERNFRRPRDFVPERWLKEYQKVGAEFASDNRAVFQPFGHGPRNCIGRNLAYAEMKVILARMLWQFDWQLDGEHEGWEDQQVFAIWMKKPLMVKLSARADA